ncbi:hypothetical protein [Stenotrophomonas maltophilia]
MEISLRAKLEEAREQYKWQLKDQQEAYGDAMREIHAREEHASLLRMDES